MKRLAHWLFGRVRFRESEEHLEFQFKVLSIVLLFGAVFTAVFVIGDATGLNPLDSPHVVTMQCFIVASFLLWGLLRGHKQRYRAVAWIYEAVCICEYVSVLAFVPQDELRVLWLLTNIPGVYLLLGPRPGLVITLLSVAGLLAGNSAMSHPYSPPALATAMFSMLYLAAFFHVYTARSLSYYERMRASNLRLYDLAMHDTLTGVLNARAYYETSERLLRGARRSNRPFAVLFFDLDHFKSINDRYGHAAGDLVLQAVAQTLERSLRRSDALGRIGGEEFSAFLPDTSLSEAAQVAESVRQAIERLQPVLASGECLRITASIGVAGHESGQDMAQIQQCADQAMYRAKAQGRNRVSLFANTLRSTPPDGERSAANDALRA